MKITEKQLLMLIHIAKDSLQFSGREIFTFDKDTRHKLIDTILNQQSNILTDCKDE